MARSSPNRRDEFHVAVQPTPVLHGTPSLNTVVKNIRVADNQHISSTLEGAIKELSNFGSFHLYLSELAFVA